jgi:transglutaminase-like putative cysteine protease
MNPRTSLAPRYCIDSDHPAIRARAAALAEGVPANIAPGPARDREVAVRIFRFVRDHITYNFAPAVRTRADFRASHTLELGNGFCMQKAALFAALCRASGIPARIGFQDIIDYKITGKFYEMMRGNELSFHGMNAVYLGGHWLKVDATLDHKLCDRKHYQLVEFDGRHDALLPRTDRDGAPHFTIKKQHLFYNDTPQFASNTMLKWTKYLPYQQWTDLVHRKHGSM